MAIDTETSKKINADMAALVADGEWHPFWQFIPILECVPPEHAVRIFLSSKGRPGKPLDEQISRGRREMLRQRLNNIVRRGTWECTPLSRRSASRGEGFDREYRLVPEAEVEAAKAAAKAAAKEAAKATKEAAKIANPAVPDVVEEAIGATQKLMALPSTKHFSGVELKDYLAYVAQLLLIKATKVKV